jgi:hypothetical protein
LIQREDERERRWRKKLDVSEVYSVDRYYRIEEEE